MKIAVLGGSFNPLHIGHAMLADTVVKECGYDKIIFVPTFMPPHKIISSGITPLQRLEMLVEFCKADGDGHFEVDSCEIDRGGISYSSDTLEYLTEKYKAVLEGKLAFIMGNEVAAEFDKWHKPERIVELADLIIARRYPDINTLEAGIQKVHNKTRGSYKGDFAVQFELENFKYPCTLLDKPLLPVSSTEIRQRLAEGRSFKYLVPQSVYEYIITNNLYQDSGNAAE